MPLNAYVTNVFLKENTKNVLFLPENSVKYFSY